MTIFESHIRIKLRKFQNHQNLVKCFFMFTSKCKYKLYFVISDFKIIQLILIN